MHQCWASEVRGRGPGDGDRSIMTMISIFLASLCLEVVNKKQNYKGTATDKHLLEVKGIHLEELLIWLQEQLLAKGPPKWLCSLLRLETPQLRPGRGM